MFISTIILGTIISISSYSWIGIWIGLEVNLLSIIPLIVKINSYSTEASIKYFITQALASTFILLAIILLSLNESVIFYNKTYFIIINSALLTKIGAAPFHFWFPEVIEGLRWTNSFIILTWQKIAPIILLIYNFTLNTFIVIIVILRILVRGVIGLNQISLRKILTFSSINHIGWIIPAIFLSLYIWLVYFLIYSLITLNLIILFYYLNSFYLRQITLNLNSNFLLKLFFIMNLFSLGGLPPFLGFYPKWLVINSLINENFYILTFLIILLTLITLFYYIRLSYHSLTLRVNSNFKILILNRKFILLINFFSLIILPILILTRSF